MCGICGVVDPERAGDSEAVHAMSAALAHRGPDGEGYFVEDGVALGFRRLAIIDLSSAGMQPFPSEDGRLQLLHNGEIYNYIELRAELESHGHNFRTATDTEVVLAAYREWGDSCVERFNGMWAIAIWDSERRRLFCSRDRFGVKPFYYRYESGRFVFASELKAFRALGPLRPNEAVIRDYLELGYLDHTPETFFESIRSLPAAHSLTLDQHGLRIQRHWSLERRDPPTGDPASAVRELFLDAVRLRLRSDVSVGTALSGGLDSSAIACAIAYLFSTDRAATRAVGPRQQTFTAYFEDTGFDERPYAEAVVAATEASPHWISFSSDELLGALQAVIAAQDEPFGSTSVVAQWFVMRQARASGMTVMLDGQGGDEVLAGYPVYWGARLADLVRQGRLLTFVAELRAQESLRQSLLATARPFVPETVRERARARLTTAHSLVGGRLRETRRTQVPLEHRTYGDHLHDTLHRIMSRHGLPELLRYEDRNSMAHSIEARVPFLDFRLVELLFALHPRELLSKGLTKIVLRRAVGDLLPATVRARRDKLGFVTPSGRFFREGLGALAGDVFTSKQFEERGFVDVAAARTRLRAHTAGQIEAGFELWRALNVELWARAYLD